MIFKFFKDRGAVGNADYEAGRQSVHKDLKIQRLQQEVDDLKAARGDLIKASMQLLKVKDIAVDALTVIVALGGKSSIMAFHAREALKKIEELDK